MQILIGTDKLSKRFGHARFYTLSQIVNRTQYAAIGLILVASVLFVALPDVVGLVTFVRLLGLAFLAIGLTLVWGDISPTRYSTYSVETVKKSRRRVAQAVGVGVLILGGVLIGAGILMLVAKV
jgi:hypothetical protein